MMKNSTQNFLLQATWRKKSDKQKEKKIRKLCIGKPETERGERRKCIIHEEPKWNNLNVRWKRNGIEREYLKMQQRKVKSLFRNSFKWQEKMDRNHHKSWKKKRKILNKKIEVKWKVQKNNDDNCNFFLDFERLEVCWHLDYFIQQHLLQ
jgi:hypothetical protein